jgi:hypothetical protein
LAHLLSNLGIPLPQALRGAADVVLNKQLRKAVEFETLDLTSVQALLDEVKDWQVEVDALDLGFSLKKTIDRIAEMLQAEPENLPLLQKLDEVVGVAQTLPLDVDYWKTQNIYFELLRTSHPRMLQAAAQGDRNAKTWLLYFSLLGDKLHANIEELKK